LKGKSVFGNSYQVFKLKNAHMLGMATIPAKKHPDRNEDAGFAEHLDNGVFIAGVFDGMGGHTAGDQACNVALDFVLKRLRNITGRESQHEIVKILGSAMEGAAVEIGHRLPGTSAGTAAVVSVVIPQKGTTNKIYIIGAADCRAYLQSNGSLELLTVDNISADCEGKETLVMDRKEVQRRLSAGKLLRLGAVEKVEDMDSATRPLFYGRNMVTNPLMEGEAYKPAITVLSAAAGSHLILTSDGVHDNLTDQEISKATQRSVPPQELAEVLVDFSRERADDGEHLRHKDDDITAVVVGL
jgi:serine/threonine protein phosphatase PrpC